MFKIIIDYQFAVSGFSRTNNSPANDKQFCRGSSALKQDSEILQFPSFPNFSSSFVLLALLINALFLIF